MTDVAKQFVVVSATNKVPNMYTAPVTLWNPDGTPLVADQTAMVPAAAQADFAGADITALKVELNAFLTKLEAAGIVLTA